MLPISKMLERVERGRDDSDLELFTQLMYLGEMITKLVAIGLVSAISDDRERHRYRQLYRLVRSDGLGDWGSVIQETLIGTSNQHLLTEAREEQQDLNQRHNAENWQHKAVSLMDFCLIQADSSYESLGTNKIAAHQWFGLFTQLRNKTRAHGAPPNQFYGQICSPLEESIRLIIDNLRIFNRPWIYLYRNLSGKYRVTKFNSQANILDFLKGREGEGYRFDEGVYIYFGSEDTQKGKFNPKCLVRVELLKTDIDATDFFLPNGGFTKNRFEFLSYITGNKQYGDSQPYSYPTTALPESETQGLGILDQQGKCFGNLPLLQRGYIKRLSLEKEMFSILSDDRHPVITLVGRGGIGKTWLALSVLHQVADTEQFDAIIWFSARDIDLLDQGPKLVKPHILRQNDIANELVRLLNPKEYKDDPKNFKPLNYLIEALQFTSTINGPILFVLDNFETVENPIELFTWINTYIRLPNKVLITTRFREFKGDYPVEVLGMNEDEAKDLAYDTAKQLFITELLTEDYLQQLYKESDGHPYVIKILLGEVAKAGRTNNIQRILANQDDILRALFERVFAGLSPVAKRIFLTLSNWRSVISLIALEAVLLRSAHERINVQGAIEELERSSFVEITESTEDQTIFITVPLVAAIFGQQKLAVSTLKSTVEVDTEILQMFGATQEKDIQYGFAPKVNRIVRNISEIMERDPSQIDEYIPMLEFVAGRYPSAWLLIAQLYQEQRMSNWVIRSKDAYTRFLETDPEPSKKFPIWRKLAEIYAIMKDSIGEIQALVESAKLPDATFNYISNASNRLNQIFKEKGSSLPLDEKEELARQMARILEGRIDEADANACSRLAWLYMHTRDYQKANIFVQLGLTKDGDNDYCWRLLSILRNEHNIG